MKLIADTHTHCVSTDHAFSTISENAVWAAKRGLMFLANTEHTATFPGAPSEVHFRALPLLPATIQGVVILKGAEVSITGANGELGLPNELLSALDWVIASFHTPDFAPQTRKVHTNIWLSIAENPAVDVIGHSGDGRYEFDYETVIKSFARNNKIVEINSNSPAVRPNTIENCKRIANICAAEGVRVVVNSDAHFCESVGNFESAIRLLKGINFPEELIINADRDRFLGVAIEKAGYSREYLETL